MQCPRCDVALAMSDRQGVEIDYCPKCRGVWLDRGELDKILDRSVKDFAPPVAAPAEAPAPGYTPSYAHQDDRWTHQHHPQGRHKRKKSFLEDIFDFD